jgi:hypothetical protein
LRQLQHIAQLGHPKLVTLEQAQQTKPRGVGQRFHPPHQARRGRRLRRLIHLFIRIIGLLQGGTLPLPDASRLG